MLPRLVARLYESGLLLERMEWTTVAMGIVVVLLVSMGAGEETAWWTAAALD